MKKWPGVSLPKIKNQNSPAHCPIFVKLVMAVYLMGAFPACVFHSGYPLFLSMDTASGLMADDPVMNRGLQIGVVKNVGLNGQQVIAELRIDSEFRIPADAQFTIASASILGDKLVNIEFEQESHVQLLIDGDTVLAQLETSIIDTSLIDNIDNYMQNIFYPDKEAARDSIILQKLENVERSLKQLQDSLNAASE